MTISSFATKKQLSWPAFTPILVATILLLLFSAIFVPRTMSGLSIQSMLPFAAVLAIAAVGQTLVIQQRGIDLSVGSMVSLAAMSIGVFSTRMGWDFLPAVLVTVLLCAAFGVVNGVLVAWVRITPLVATLAMNAVITGVVVVLTNNIPASAPDSLVSFVGQKIFGLSSLVWVAIVFVIVMAIVTTKTVEGRRFVAVGANPAAAATNGISRNRSIFVAYVTASLSYALAGVLMAGYLRNTTMQVGDNYMLQTIAVVIVGGTPLIGGRGTIIGTAIGALFMSQLIQLVLTIGAPTSIQMLIEAVAIALAATLQGLSGRAKRKRVKPQAVYTQSISSLRSGGDKLKSVP